MKKAKTKRKYSPELKTDVVALIHEGKSPKEIRKLYKVTDATIYRWKHEAKKKRKRPVELRGTDSMRFILEKTGKVRKVKRKKPDRRSHEEKIMDAQDRMIARTTKQPEKLPVVTMDAIIYLDHAVIEMQKQERKNDALVSKAHAYVILALATLKGE
jgi:transposase-like protein